MIVRKSEKNLIFPVVRHLHVGAHIAVSGIVPHQRSRLAPMFQIVRPDKAGLKIGTAEKQVNPVILCRQHRRIGIAIPHRPFDLRAHGLQLTPRRNVGRTLRYGIIDRGIGRSAVAGKKRHHPVVRQLHKRRIHMIVIIQLIEQLMLLLLPRRRIIGKSHNAALLIHIPADHHIPHINSPRIGKPAPGSVVRNLVILLGIFRRGKRLSRRSGKNAAQPNRHHTDKQSIHFAIHYKLILSRTCKTARNNIVRPSPVCNTSPNSSTKITPPPPKLPSRSSQNHSFLSRKPEIILHLPHKISIFDRR